MGRVLLQRKVRRGGGGGGQRARRIRWWRRYCLSSWTCFWPLVVFSWRARHHLPVSVARFTAPSPSVSALPPARSAGWGPPPQLVDYFRVTGPVSLQPGSQGLPPTRSPTSRKLPAGEKASVEAAGKRGCRVLTGILRPGAGVRVCRLCRQGLYCSGRGPSSASTFPRGFPAQTPQRTPASKSHLQAPLQAQFGEI